MESKHFYTYEESNMRNDEDKIDEKKGFFQ